MIAHRLSTIRNADKVIVMQKGEVVEEGDHNTLMMSKGTYFNLVQQQNLHQIEEDESLIVKEEEEEELIKRFLSQFSNNTLNEWQQGKVSIPSLTPSVLAAINGKNLNVDDDEDEETKSKIKVIK